RSAPFIFAQLAVATEQEVQYIQNRGIEKEECKRRILQYLTKFGSIVRKKFEELLIPALSTTMSSQQKRDFIKNLIQEMRREGTIRKISGQKSNAVWILSKPEFSRNREFSFGCSGYSKGKEAIVGVTGNGIRPMVRVDTAKWGQSADDLRRLSVEAPHPR